MNYTKNYHLPQWAKEDRIMMDDFNQMCADLETRLTGRDNAAADGSGLTWNAILRSAWNMMDSQHALAADTGISSWSGLTVNPLASADMASGLSGITWLDEASGVYIGSGPEVPETVLRETCTGITVGSTGSELLTTASYCFTAPLTGSVAGFVMQGTVFLSNTKPTFSGQFSFLAEEKNGTSWRTVYRKANITTEHDIANGNASPIHMDVSVNVPITKGREYRFTLTREAANVLPLGHFGFTSTQKDSDTGEIEDDSLFTLKHKVSTSGSHTRAVPTDGSASRALLAAFYRTAQSGGAVSALLDGKTMSLVSNQEAAYKDGKPCRQARFLLEGNFSGSPALKLDLSCGASNTLRLLSYTVMFL